MNLDQITDAPDILMEFLEYHSTVRGHSDQTVAAYYLDLKILFRYLKRRRKLVDPKTPFSEIDISDIDVSFSEDRRDAGELTRFIVDIDSQQARSFQRAAKVRVEVVSVAGTLREKLLQFCFVIVLKRIFPGGKELDVLLCELISLCL